MVLAKTLNLSIEKLVAKVGSQIFSPSLSFLKGIQKVAVQAFNKHLYKITMEHTV